MFKQEVDEAAVLTALTQTLQSDISKGGRCSLSRTLVIMICGDIEKATERAQPLSG